VDRDEILMWLRERIVAFAASRVGKDSAEDLAQETLVVLEEKYPQVMRLDELLPLSLQILRFKLGAQRRKWARRGEYTSVSVDDVSLTDGAEDPEQAFERSELRERLLRAVGEMEHRCRQMFRMKLEGQSFEQIRIAMAIRSLNTIYTWDLRCRKKLMEKLGGRWGGDFDINSRVSGAGGSGRIQ
jgi:RNA polymerase sigma-70 factor (ECF subfamily)